MERADLTEPFTALLDRGDTAMMEKAVTLAEDVMTPSQTASDALISQGTMH